MASPQIERLINRLPELDQAENALNAESNTCAYFAVDDSGEVKTTVTDPGRLAEIRQEREAIHLERAAIQDKLSQLKELLGENLIIPSTAGLEDSKQRLISELGIFFEHKVLRSNPHVYILPEEAIKDPRYLKKASEILPLIEATEARIRQTEEKQRAAAAILAA